MESVLHRIYIGSLGPVKYYEPRSVEFWKQNEQVKEGRPQAAFFSVLHCAGHGGVRVIARAGELCHVF